MTFNDLRGTAVTRLALVGCSEAEIATITGHSLRDVRSILDAHYLQPRPGARRERDHQARNGIRDQNGHRNFKMSFKTVYRVLTAKGGKSRTGSDGWGTRIRT